MIVHGCVFIRVSLPLILIHTNPLLPAYQHDALEGDLLDGIRTLSCDLNFRGSDIDIDVDINDINDGEVSSIGDSVVGAYVYCVACIRFFIPFSLISLTPFPSYLYTHNRFSYGRHTQ